MSQSRIDPATRHALEALLTEFAHRVDNGLGDTVHELFTEDGSIAGPGLAMNGRSEIAKQFTARAKEPGRVSRHFWSNPRFERLDERSIRVVTLIQTFVHRREEGEELPAERYSLIVGDSIDVMQRCDDGCWRFASRRLEVAFRVTP
jgi:3-phenylpropionate/cinnamic acid dioxygenase small subunit